MLQHTSVIDATPEIHSNGLALTMLLEFEVARQIEVLLEGGARLGRPHGIEDEAQGIKLRLAPDQIVDEMVFFLPHVFGSLRTPVPRHFPPTHRSCS